jgi:hypothetical protein
MAFSQTAFADCTPTPDEKQIWDSIKGSSDPREFLSYLKQFPQGCFKAIANFKIKSLVAEFLPLEVSFMFTAENNWRTAHEGQWLDFGDGRPVEWMKLRAGPADPNTFKLEYMCDGAGVGNTGWFSGDQSCPGPRAPIQGFSVRMRGWLKDFYDLEVLCSTHHRPSNSLNQDWQTGDEGWCGVHGGAGQIFVYKANITAKRKKFDN